MARKRNANVRFENDPRRFYLFEDETGATRGRIYNGPYLDDIRPGLEQKIVDRARAEGKIDF